MKTLTDTELAGFRPVPREMLRPTDEDRRAIREQFRSGVRKKVTNATFQAVNGEDSPRFQKLRQQPLRVAYYMRDSAEDEFFVLYLNNMLMLDTRKNGRLFLSEVDELFHIIPRHHDEFRLDPVAKEFLEEYVSFEMFRSGLYY